MQKKFDIFISYSRKDLDAVEAFIRFLKEKIPSLNYWLDLTGIESAEEFDEKIIAAIDNSTYVLFFVSPNSMDSVWTKNEVMYAKNSGKKVVPILLKGAKLEGWFLFHFGNIDCIDITKKEQKDKLAANLSTWLGKETVGVDRNDTKKPIRDVNIDGDFDDNNEKKKKDDLWGEMIRMVRNYKSVILKVSILIITLLLSVWCVSQCDGDDGDFDTLSLDSLSLDTTNVDYSCIGTENGHDYVDLGLSAKWATCNVGASSPEEYGSYFAWGETKSKSDYSWDTYKWCRGTENTMTKYCTDSEYGTIDSKTRLDLSDDAARVNWGGSWRMPTHDECTELRENCSWTWTTQNGVYGYKVTSKTNGKSIFLPAAGYCGGTSLYRAGSRGCYWSSSLDTRYPGSVRCLYFYSSSVGWSSYDRYDGQSVRPVYP